MSNGAQKGVGPLGFQVTRVCDLPSVLGCSCTDAKMLKGKYVLRLK